MQWHLKFSHEQYLCRRTGGFQLGHIHLHWRFLSIQFSGLYGKSFFMWAFQPPEFVYFLKSRIVDLVNPVWYTVQHTYSSIANVVRFIFSARLRV